MIWPLSEGCNFVMFLGNMRVYVRYTHTRVARGGERTKEWAKRAGVGIPKGSFVLGGPAYLGGRRGRVTSGGGGGGVKRRQI